MIRYIAIAVLCLSCVKGDGGSTVPQDKIIFILRSVVEALEHSGRDASIPADASIDVSEELPRGI